MPPSSKRKNSRPTADAWDGSPPPACFVLTDSCLSISDAPPCREDNFGHIFLSRTFQAFSHHEWDLRRFSLGDRLRACFVLKSWTREDIHNLWLKNARDDESLESNLLATAFIYVSPCERLISQAMGICVEASGSNLFRLLVRVDSRLSVSCCPPGMEYERLVSLLHYFGKLKNSYYYEFLD